MIELDIVYPHVGRSYRTSWETVAGCAVSDDPQWRVPVSLHYHYGLLDAGKVSRYVARVAVSSRAPRRTRSSQQTAPPVVAPVSSARLVFAPADDTTPPVHRAPTLDTPTPDAPPTPPPPTPPVQMVPSSAPPVAPAVDDGAAGLTGLTAPSRTQRARSRRSGRALRCAGGTRPSGPARGRRGPRLDAGGRVAPLDDEFGALGGHSVHANRVAPGSGGEVARRTMMTTRVCPMRLCCRRPPPASPCRPYRS